MRFNRYDTMTADAAVACKETQEALAASNAIIDSALGSMVSRAQAQKLTMAQCAGQSSDPYQAAINGCNMRGADTDARTRSFWFADGSELVFDVTYTARRVAQESR